MKQIDKFRSPSFRADWSRMLTAAEDRRQPVAVRREALEWLVMRTGQGDALMIARLWRVFWAIQQQEDVA